MINRDERKTDPKLKHPKHLEIQKKFSKSNKGMVRNEAKIVKKHNAVKKEIKEIKKSSPEQLVKKYGHSMKHSKEDMHKAAKHMKAHGG